MSASFFGSNLVLNFVEATSMILFAIGMTLLLLSRNMIKKIIGFNFMDTGTYLFLAAKGYIVGGTAPIVQDVTKPYGVETFINPVPAALVLTGIVVSVSVTAVYLAMTVIMYERYHTIEIDEIMIKVRKEEQEL